MKGLFHCTTCNLPINDSVDMINHIGNNPEHIIVTGDRS